MVENTKTPTPTPSLRYDLHNPTNARRVVYDGIEGSQKPIVVEAQSTKHDVCLHADLVKELRERNKRTPDSDLVPKLLAPEKTDA